MKKVNILIVQFRKEKEKIKSEQNSFNRLFKTYPHKYISIFDKRTKIFDNVDNTLKIYTHIILGGSSEFGLSKETVHPQEKIFIVKKAQKLLNNVVIKDHPLLGICFGHHLLALTQKAKIFRSDSQRELGKINVKFTSLGKKDKLFNGFKNNFEALTAHIESVTKLQPNFKVLASTNKCKVAAFRIKNRVYGVQFHPELDKSEFLKRLNMGNKDNDDYKNMFKIGITSTSKILSNFLNL